jgi:predicted acyl esterase
MSTILIEKNVMVPMRDGVKLATDIYRLEGASPTPVLVVRTPYNKDHMVAGGDIFDILRPISWLSLFALKVHPTLVKPRIRQ